MCRPNFTLFNENLIWKVKENLSKDLDLAFVVKFYIFGKNINERGR